MIHFIMILKRYMGALCDINHWILGFYWFGIPFGFHLYYGIEMKPKSQIINNKTT